MQAIQAQTPGSSSNGKTFPTAHQHDRDVSDDYDFTVITHDSAAMPDSANSAGHVDASPGHMRH